MKLSFTIKSLGKKKPVLNSLFIDLDLQAESSTQELLEKLVEQQVKAFNSRKSESNLIDFLQEGTLQESAELGNVKFNEQYNETTADQEKAIQNVIQAFEDGLIALFLQDNQLEDLSETISLKEEDSITIIRLTFLAGSFW